MFAKSADALCSAVLSDDAVKRWTLSLVRQCSAREPVDTRFQAVATTAPWCGPAPSEEDRKGGEGEGHSALGVCGPEGVRVCAVQCIRGGGGVKPT